MLTNNTFYYLSLKYLGSAWTNICSKIHQKKVNNKKDLRKKKKGKLSNLIHNILEDFEINSSTKVFMFKRRRSNVQSIKNENRCSCVIIFYDVCVKYFKLMGGYVFAVQ